jgi:hypothetical protein
VRYLEDRNLLRIAHALETLTLIFHALSGKRFANRGLDLLTVAAGGAADAHALFARLLPAAAALAERYAQMSRFDALTQLAHPR